MKYPSKPFSRTNLKRKKIACFHLNSPKQPDPYPERGGGIKNLGEVCPFKLKLAW
jgi:hypothetical protein